MKTKVFFLSVYIAKVIPCLNKVSLKILNALVRYVWFGNPENHNSFTISDPKAGLLGLLHPKLFYKSLFMTDLQRLIGPKCSKCFQFCIFIACPLRKLIPNINNDG